MNAQPKVNALYVKKLNKIKVLNLIREKKSISRADIAKITHLSPPTVTRAVDELINQHGLALEVGEGQSQGGRPPVLIRFNGDRNLVIGIDLGTTQIHGILSNLHAAIISEIRIPTEVHSGAEGVLERVQIVINRLIEDSSVDPQKILGIGMAVAGLIDNERDIVAYSPDFDWHNVDVKGFLKQSLSIPIIFDNVTRVMALGELWYGVGNRFKDFICINVGHGIGSGIITGGRPFYGANGMAGEFGHFTMDKDSPILCACGNTGCLEALASGRGIALSARNCLADGKPSLLRDLCHNDLDLISAEMVAMAAQQGDNVARDVFLQALEYLGVGIAGLINLFNPEAVVIGGGVTQAGALFFDHIREHVAQRVMHKHTRGVEILPVTLGMRSAVMGAVSLILNEVLSLNIGDHG